MSAQKTLGTGPADDAAVSPMAAQNAAQARNGPMTGPLPQTKTGKAATNAGDAGPALPEGGEAAVRDDL